MKPPVCLLAAGLLAKCLVLPAIAVAAEQPDDRHLEGSSGKDESDEDELDIEASQREAPQNEEPQNEEPQNEEPLTFDFVTRPTGRKVSLDTHQLHVECLGMEAGAGVVTVLFEPGLGGHALEWRPVERLLADRARTCTYDRAGYGWSGRSPYSRDALQLAREADQLLGALNVDGPLILVGHSFGGFIVRQLARLREPQLVGLVLVDASHEDQFDRLEGLGDRHALPRGPNFVLSAIEVPEGLPEPLRRRVAAFARMHKTYAAIHGELAAFRRSADQLQEDLPVVDYPVRVLRRGLELYRGRDNSAAKNLLWRELQDDLATLSLDGRVIVAAGSGHHIHIEQPELVADVVIELIENATDMPDVPNLPGAADSQGTSEPRSSKERQ